jgi:streptogrisin D
MPNLYERDWWYEMGRILVDRPRRGRRRRCGGRCGGRQAGAVSAVLAAAGALALVIAAAGHAQDAPGLSQPSEPSTAAVSSDDLSTLMDASSAGGYLDPNSGTTIVNVTDGQTAARVRAAGAAPRSVAHSGATLASVEAALAAQSAAEGTSWFTDPITNRVIVTADETVAERDLDRLVAATARFGDAVQVRRDRGRLTTMIAGGDTLYEKTGGTCSLGFNVRRDKKPYLLTAGHCVTDSKAAWFADAEQTQRFGAVVGSTFPGKDYALIENSSRLPSPGAIKLGDNATRDVSRVRTAVVGEKVQRSGSTSGLHSGTVIGVNVTANFRQGTVTGLIKTDVCIDPGDSGGPLVAGNTALGIASGGRGNCTEGGVSYYQPITEALAHFNVTLATGTSYH